MLASEQGASGLGLPFAASSELAVGGLSTPSVLFSPEEGARPLEAAAHREEPRDWLDATRAPQGARGSHGAQVLEGGSPATRSNAKFEARVDDDTESQISQATTAEP